MPKLFESIKLRDLEVKNRIWISPMCQYSCENKDGVPGSWHEVHLVSRAIGGAGLIIVEASGVTPEGRITPWCTGIWSDEQAKAWKKIVDLAHSHGAKMAMQLAHAGRKASNHREASGVGSISLAEGGWETVSSTDQAFGDYAAPRKLSLAEIGNLVEAFGQAAKRSVEAGFDAVEIHGAHGYLLHQFLETLLHCLIVKQTLVNDKSTIPSLGYQEIVLGSDDCISSARKWTRTPKHVDA